jgi:hypothetical protein
MEMVLLARPVLAVAAGWGKSDPNEQVGNSTDLRAAVLPGVAPADQEKAHGRETLPPTYIGWFIATSPRSVAAMGTPVQHPAR